MEVGYKIQDFKIGQVSDCVLSYLILSYLILSYLILSYLIYLRLAEKNFKGRFETLTRFESFHYVKESYYEKTHLDNLFSNRNIIIGVCGQFLLWRRKDKGAVLCRTWKDVL